jgi:hypothetical protein
MGLAVLLVVAEATARLRQESTLADTLRLVRGDLGLPGLVLLIPWLGGAPASVPRRRVWLGLAAVALLTTPLPGPVRAAALLPWTWWIAGATVAQLVHERGTPAPRWAVVALAAWVALHAAQVPWGHQYQQAALVRSWAEAVTARASAQTPIVTASTARDALVSALVSRTPDGAAARLVPLGGAAAASAEGRHPVVLSAHGQGTLRWQGVALDDIEGGMGTSVERLLDGLPRGVVTVAVIAEEAARRLTPAHWQSLGRVGLRLADAGQARAHALVGVTGARVGGLEAAQAESVRLDVQPGDPLGRLETRSPVDLRLEADISHVNVWLRGQPTIVRAPGLALVFFSTRGDLLAWRSGPDPEHLDGPPLGDGVLARSQAVTALPCLDIRPGVESSLAALTSMGALGISLTEAGRAEVAITRPGTANDAVRLATPTTPEGPVLSAGPGAGVSLTFPAAGVAGLLLRGPVAQAVVRASAPGRVCGAWPMLHAISLASGPVTMAVGPGLEPFFGRGWHDVEFESGTGHFRWMAGASADLLFALRNAEPLLFSVDIQGPEAPQPDDTVHLAINGHDAGLRPLRPIRGLYEWRVDPAHLMPGPNTFTLTTTRTRRPIERQPGADPRLLGLLVRGWSFRAADR